MTLHGKTVLIIGGSSGFGFSVARQVAKAGATPIITGRDEAKLAQAVTSLREDAASAQGFRADTKDQSGLAALFAKLGSFDHLVSTAGGFMGGGFLDAAFEVIEKAVHEKLFDNLTIARLARPYLREGGSMVFTAGSGGRPHNASGAIIGNDAIKTMVAGLAVELAPHGRANAVAPTWTRTPLWRNMPAEQVDATEKYFTDTIPLKRTAAIDEVASAYVFLMENGFVTGQTITVDGGLTLVS